MSRRTAEANKAIAAKWEIEQQLVREGKGTRDWTPEQQQDILERGKAYDENGYAFEGQHMKSVNMYPEYQGEPDNIQFLTKSEHLEAHGGSWHNPTNWYYNPITKQKTVFGDALYQPCEIMELSYPIIPATSSTPDIIGDNIVQAGASTFYTDTAQDSQYVEDAVYQKTATTTSLRTPKPRHGFKRAVQNVVQFAKEFPVKHPVLTTAIEVGGAVLAGVVLSKDDDSRSSGGSSTNNSDRSGLCSTRTYDSDPKDADPTEPCEEDYSTKKRDYPEERRSPIEHDVSGYERQQNGKTVYVPPYTRGGKHDSDPDDDAYD